MRPSSSVIVLATFLIAGVVACGGDDDKDPTGPGPEEQTHFLRAKIDGVAWSVPASGVAFAASHTSPGLYVMIGQPSGDYRLQFVLSNITGAGTYPLGVGALVRGGTVTLSDAPATWITPPSGAAGSITLSQLSDTLMSGTFHFSANSVPGTATGTKTVTEGEFQVPVTTIGNIGPLPDNAWSEVRATIADSPWNAANIATNFVTTTLSIVAFNDTRTITITLADVTAPGTYSISNTPPLRSMTSIGDGIDPLVCCWGNFGAATGTVTIASITPTRIAGSFSASLEPSPSGGAAGTLEIENGTFDTGRPVAP